jgi:cell division protein FtsI (penicillin-binding protein 3)
MLLFLFAVIVRVVNIQYTQGEKYRKLSTELTIKQDVIYANKGNVYASDGNLLATSMSKFTIRMDVVAVASKTFEKNIVELSKELSNMLGKTPSYYQEKLRIAKKRKNRYLLIARNIGYNDYLKMKQFPIFNRGVYKGGFIAEQKNSTCTPNW